MDNSIIPTVVIIIIRLLHNNIYSEYYVNEECGPSSEDFYEDMNRYDTDY